VSRQTENRNRPLAIGHRTRYVYGVSCGKMRRNATDSAEPSELIPLTTGKGEKPWPFLGSNRDTWTMAAPLHTYAAIGSYWADFASSELIWLSLPVLLLFGLFAVAFARRSCRKTYTCYYGERVACGLSGSVVARRLLDMAGLTQITVSSNSKRNLYDWRKHDIQLDPNIFSAASLSSLATAAHEVGHALQFTSGYFPARLRRLCPPLGILLYAIALLTIVMPWTRLVAGSMALLALSFFTVLVIVQLPITLILERDASRRAGQLVRQAELIAPGEQRGFDQLLKAGFLTYVATVLCIGIVLGGVSLGTLLKVSDSLSEFIAYMFEVDAPLVPAPEEDEREGEVPARQPPNNGPVPLSPEQLSAMVFWRLAIISFSVVVILGPYALSRYLRNKRPNRRTAKAVERYNAAVALTSQGAWEAAIAEFNEAIRLQPKLFSAYQGRGMARTQLGQLDAAVADVDRAIALQPGVASFHSLRGTIHFRRRDFDQALIDYNKALRLYPESALALQGRSVTWLYQGNFEQAIDDADRALQYAPADPVGFNNRGAALLRTGAYDRARTDLQQAIRLSSTFPNPYKHLAWLQATCPQDEFRNGTQAVANAIRALELAKWQPIDWLAVLAAAYAEAGNFEEAVKWQTKSLDGSLPEEKAELQKRLERYRNRKPYRDCMESK
jgi:Zn-dependent membrane protease YugP/tetratricopeptide (TPR) repeat protein